MTNGIFFEVCKHYEGEEILVLNLEFFIIMQNMKSQNVQLLIIPYPFCFCILISNITVTVGIA